MSGTAQERRGWRWGRLVLAISLALNLAVIGALAGAFWRHAGERDHGPRGGPRGGFAAPYMRALPREDRRAMWETLRTARTEDHRAQRRAQYQAVLATLRAEPFDPEAVRAALDIHHGDAQSFRERAETAWLERVAAMDAQERQAYAARVEEELERGRKRRGRRSD